MDRIAKLVSGRLKGQAIGPHPDPDLLAALAEHALPDAERAQLVEHLGACSDCREVLYLAMPDSAEAQRVLSFRPTLRSGVALRWGALVASVAILTGVFAARYSLYNAHRQSPAAAAAPAPSSYAKISQDKVPPELNAMRDALAKKAAPEPVAPRTVEKSRPEAKHMTAKPLAALDFEDSGQVRLLAPQNSDESRNLSVQNLPLNGRNEAPLTNRAASAASPAPQPAGGLSKESNAFGLASVNSNLETTGSSGRGNFAGIISDTTGATVGKAKVTMVGPVGPKTATSDDSGRFSFDRLTPGLYSIKAEASGFKPTEIKQVAVLVNGTPPVQVKLEPGSASEVVEVTGAAPPLDNTVIPTAALNSSTGFVGGEEQTTVQLKLQKAAAANTRQAGAGTGGSAMPVPPLPQWTLSPEGVVQRSFDTGKSWQMVSVSNGVIFRALSAAGTNVWVGGSAGALYHSADSGQTWAKLTPTAGGKKLDQDIVHLDFSDGQSGIVTTSNGEVWTTFNGGQTWRRK